MEAGLTDHVWSLEELVGLLEQKQAEAGSMKKRAVLIAAAIVASAIYDFYRGYHETRSILSGLIWVVGGLVVLALFWWLYSYRQHSKTN